MRNYRTKDPQVEAERRRKIAEAKRANPSGAAMSGWKHSRASRRKISQGLRKSWARRRSSSADYEKSREPRLRKKYGITLIQYQEMMDEQGGVCKICGRTPKGRRLAVDHDHETGQIRGLLCISCNFLVGQAQRLGKSFLEYLVWVIKL